MQYQNKYGTVFRALLLGFLLLLSGMDIASASSEAAQHDTVGVFTQWPMAVWYGLSIVLALIGLIKAKS